MAQNSTVTTKPKVKRGPGKPFSGGDDPRRNNGGRPKNKTNITYWMREFGNMTPAEVAERCEIYAKELKRGGDELPIFGVIAVRALMELMNDPSAGRLFGQVIERLEGKLPTTIKTWRDEVVDLLRSGSIMPGDVVKEFGDDLATELFVSAGIPIGQNRKVAADITQEDNRE